MPGKGLCVILIAILFANVDYAQLITINTLGKTISTTKTGQQQKLGNKPAVKDSSGYRDVAIPKWNEMNVALPLDFLTVTAAFGERIHPIYHREQLHAGVDLRASYEQVYAFAGGMVSQAGYDSKSGNYITLLHSANVALSSAYAHLNYLLVKVGDTVQAGQVIGISGNTGASTAPHLHFALKVDNRPINPVPVLKLLVQLLSATGELNDTEKSSQDIERE